MKIPKLNLQDFSITTNGELGIPAKYLIEPINLELQKYQGLIHDTDTDTIELDTPIFTFRDGGFTLQGNVRIQARKLLGTVPLIGATYTPWIPLAGTFQEQLTADIIEGRLIVTHAQFDFVASEDLYGQLANDFVLPYLNEKVITSLNELLANFNGMTIEELFMEYGQDRLQGTLDSKGLTKDRVNLMFKILGKSDRVSNALQIINQTVNSVRVNAKISPEYLWLSAIPIRPQKVVEVLEGN